MSVQFPHRAKVSDGWKKFDKACPKCGTRPASFGLMMHECDSCLCNLPREDDPFVQRNGLYIPREKAA